MKWKYWSLTNWARSRKEENSRRSLNISFDLQLTVPGTGAEGRKKAGAGGVELLSPTYVRQEQEEEREQEQEEWSYCSLLT
jgi:hypothetical protein